MEWINQLKEKKIQNNIAIRFLFLFFIVLLGLVLTFLFFTNNILFTQTEGLLFNLLGGVSLIFCFYNFFIMYKFLPSK